MIPESVRLLMTFARVKPPAVDGIPYRCYACDVFGAARRPEDAACWACGERPELGRAPAMGSPMIVRWRREEVGKEVGSRSPRAASAASASSSGSTNMQVSGHNA